MDSTTSKRHFGPAQIETTEPTAGPPVARRLPASPGAARLVAGRYRLRALLGRGGMGRVWLAEDELLHRPVALKQAILSERTSDDWYPADKPDRLLIEACAAATVNHQGAVTIYDVVTEDSQNWIVMEPLSGHTLAELITVEGPLSIAQVTRIGVGLLDVLMAAHRVGILHCDVKPANVHFCDDGRVVLTDFGIACRMVDEANDHTRPLAGSPLYTAPERLRGGNPEPASDMFALGATLFTALEGKPPFSNGRSLFDTVLRSLRAYRRRACTPDRYGLSSKDCSPRTPQTGSRGRKRARLSLDIQQQLQPDPAARVLEGVNA